MSNEDLGKKLEPGTRVTRANDLWPDNQGVVKGYTSAGWIDVLWDGREYTLISPPQHVVEFKEQ